MIGRRFVLFLSALPVGLPIAASIGRAQSGQPAPSRLALKGYDPVAYFTDGKATPGDPQYESTYDGTRYRFASAQHLGLFKADPDRYAPQYAGSCATGIALGVKVEADPQNWLIQDGKLFVFSATGARDDMRADPRGTIAKAGENWKNLASAPYQ
jgi:YHS domain-containing protein